ncbi:MAG: helix-turn-helix transcriptional regulator [Polyangia bacterium]
MVDEKDKGRESRNGRREDGRQKNEPEGTSGDRAGEVDGEKMSHPVVKNDSSQRSGGEDKPMPSVAKARGGSGEPGAEGREVNNRLREYRIERMMSKAELARKAGLSVLTVSRIEKGYNCRMDTKRKILKALGLKLSDRRKVFEDD